MTLLELQDVLGERIKIATERSYFLLLGLGLFSIVVTYL